MKRTPINPWSWSLNVGYHQAEILEGGRRQLICAGQTDVDEAMKHFDALGARFGPLDVKPPMTLLGVTRLALAELMFEI